MSRNGFIFTRLRKFGPQLQRAVAQEVGNPLFTVIYGEITTRKYTIVNGYGSVSLSFSLGTTTRGTLYSIHVMRGERLENIALRGAS